MSLIAQLNEKSSNVISDVNNATSGVESLLDNTLALFDERRKRMNPQKGLLGINSFAKNCNFYINFPLSETLIRIYKPSKMEDILMQCETIQLPSQNLATFTHRGNGISQKLPYDAIYNEITLTFRTDDKYHIRRFFQDWIKSIQNPEGNRFRYLNTYAVPLTINAINSKGVTQMQIELVDAYPNLIGGIQFDANNTDITTFSVSFLYTKWLEVPVSENGLMGQLEDTANDVFSKFT